MNGCHGENRCAEHPAATGKGDAGLSTIEVVILAPVMMMFVLVLVAFGQLVDGRSSVDSAARDAARAGSLQREAGAAMAAARQAAAADLGDICTGPPTVRKTSAGFEPGGLFSVEVSCQVRGLAMIGLDIGTRISGTSSSPIDPYRRAA
ncbi:pilus assembly protein [Streptomyces sp. JJ66]|uniref:TadE/TadG family type IV pilus assembly protein n=1 Tax=Streptomyces sp. JJ66 TaxID=2803843 RepID=UPI001C5677C1|nr:TadE/TadG family type IV pilus assembly protein [Streptomyces sp. JJ66]MBW1601171.1 pilus assembly protein [Streptomyces sp. JJ66]